MDVHHRMSAWATALVQTSPVVQVPAAKLAKYVDVHTAKFIVQLSVLGVPELMGDETHEVAAVIQAVDPVVDKTSDLIVEATWEIAAEKFSAEQVLTEALNEILAEKSLEERAQAEAAIKEDAVKAADAIEKYSAELEKQQAEEPALAKDEADWVKDEFTQERKETMDKLDELEKLYFENHPDMDEKQQAAAESRFADIRKEEMDGIDAREDARMAELELFQQERHEDLIQKQREVEDTRDERS